MESLERNIDKAMGVDIFRRSVVQQAVYGLVGGLAEAIYTLNLETVHPEILRFSQVIYCSMIISVGSRNTLFGTLFFAPILWLISGFFAKAVAEFGNIAFGTIVILFLVFKQKGLIDEHLILRIGGCSNSRRLIPAR